MTDRSPPPVVSLVYDGPHIQALVRKGTSDFVLVTFNGRGFPANGQTFWAAPVAETLDLNAIGFVSKAPNWFPKADLDAAITAVLPHIAPFAERIGYGYSQGAYGAIKASRPLGLTATIAISPQWSIDPADVIDDRYNRFFDPALNTGMAIGTADLPERLLLLADTGHLRDRAHLDPITHALGDFTLINVPSSAHDTINVFRGTNAFTTLLDAVRSGAPLAPVTARLRRASNVRNEVIIKQLLKRKRLDRALQIFFAVKLDRESKTATLLKFIRRGAATQILRVARRHSSQKPKDSYAMAVLAMAFAGAGWNRLAQKAAETTLELGGHGRAIRLARIVERGGRIHTLDIDADDDDDDDDV